MQTPNAIPGLIQVLWIEDDPVVTNSYPAEAEQYDLQLVHFPCWDDAKVALESDFNRWEAIILDAKCKVHAGSTDNAPQFLGNVILGITSICQKKQRPIPWYVLTGDGSKEVLDSIPENRQEWDGDWKKVFYEKTVDREFLYRRIRHRVKRAPSMFIHQHYSDVFNAIESLGIGDYVYNAMEDLLTQIHFSTLTSKDYNDKFKNVRTVIEDVFRSMMNNGMLPEQIKVNTAWSCRILSGKDCYDKKSEPVVTNCVNILPTVLEKNLMEMIFTSASYLHTDCKEDTDTRHTRPYLEAVGNTPYLLEGYALHLCDFILWYKKFLDDNPNQDINRTRWKQWQDLH